MSQNIINAIGITVLIIAIWFSGFFAGWFAHVQEWKQSRPKTRGWYLLEIIPPKSATEVTSNLYVVVWANYNSNNIFQMFLKWDTKIVKDTDFVNRHLSIPEPKE